MDRPPPAQTTVFRRGFLWVGLSTAAGASLAGLQSAPIRTGALAGALAAGVGSVLALLFLRLTLERTLKQVLSALVGGMLLRMLLLAAGMLAAHALGGELLAFAGGFFAVYVIHQVIELTLVAKLNRARQAEGKA